MPGWIGQWLPEVRLDLVGRPRVWHYQDQYFRAWAWAVYFGAGAAGVGIIAALVPRLSFVGWPVAFTLLSAMGVCIVINVIYAIRWWLARGTELYEIGQTAPEELASQIRAPNIKWAHVADVTGFITVGLIFILILLRNHLSTLLVASVVLLMLALSAIRVYAMLRT